MNKKVEKETPSNTLNFACSISKVWQGRNGFAPKLAVRNGAQFREIVFKGGSPIKLKSVSEDINQILRTGSQENVQLTAVMNKFKG